MKFSQFYYFISSIIICIDGQYPNPISGFIPPPTGPWVARADLHADSFPIPMGSLIFSQADSPGSPVSVTGTLFNLIPNTQYHGFHVHMFPLFGGLLNCSYAGEHWNPYGRLHGARFDPIDRRHVGDLGNIWSDQFGNAIINFEDFIIQLDPGSISSILGKSIVVHKDMDDLGRGVASDTATTGHAGARIACGNIQITDPGLYQGNYRRRMRWRRFLPKSCDCMTTTGQCVNQGTSQCSFHQGISIIQCMGKNQWIPIKHCSLSCKLSADSQPFCI